jgi:hypothetical protein
MIRLRSGPVRAEVGSVAATLVRGAARAQQAGSWRRPAPGEDRTQRRGVWRRRRVNSAARAGLALGSALSECLVVESARTSADSFGSSPISRSSLAPPSSAGELILLGRLRERVNRATRLGPMPGIGLGRGSCSRKCPDPCRPLRPSPAPPINRSVPSSSGDRGRIDLARPAG